ncbi:hypothetical protein GGS21DRAFT_293775 [Xylaria nigripes]|nr:hypothetical protein GGS21DRAFT_293775 [Xylaria nigripes]
MSSTPTRSSRVQNLTQRYNALSSEAPSPTESSSESTCRVRFTGECREPIRERLRRLESKSSAPLRPGTPFPGKRESACGIAPQTSPALPAMSEYPKAPIKTKVHSLRQLSRGQNDVVDDILLDKKVNTDAKRPAMLLGLPRNHCVSPDGTSPLRQSWAPEDFNAVNVKLQAFITESDNSDDEKSEMELPVSSERVEESGSEDEKQKAEADEKKVSNAEN